MNKSFRIKALQLTIQRSRQLVIGEYQRTNTNGEVPYDCALIKGDLLSHFKIIAIDIAGPFPKTDSGNKYILITMDYFSKRVEAYTPPNQALNDTVAPAVRSNGRTNEVPNGFQPKLTRAINEIGI